MSIPQIEVDLAKLEHKTAEFSAVSAFQVIPVLELDDGTVIGESIVIRRYVEELHPGPNQFGATPIERATVEMAQRRVGVAPSAAGLPGLPSYPPAYGENGRAQVAECAAANRPRALRNMMIFDDILRKRPFIAGDRFTVADVTGLVALDFARCARIAIPPDLANLNRWHEALKARPSASA